MPAPSFRQLTQSAAADELSAMEAPVSTHLHMALGIAINLAHAAQYSNDAIASAYDALCQALRLNPTVHHLQPDAGAASAIHGRTLTTQIGRRQRCRTEERFDEGPLSARQQCILGLIASGLSNKEIARSLGISPETVKTHVATIFLKLGVERRAQAVAFAGTLGMIQGRTTRQQPIMARPHGGGLQNYTNEG